jgi:hypothetical protein
MTDIVAVAKGAGIADSHWVRGAFFCNCWIAASPNAAAAVGRQD